MHAQNITTSHDSCNFKEHEEMQRTSTSNNASIFTCPVIIILSVLIRMIYFVKGN